LENRWEILGNVSTVTKMRIFSYSEISALHPDTRYQVHDLDARARYCLNAMMIVKLHALTASSIHHATKPMDPPHCQTLAPNAQSSNSTPHPRSHAFTLMPSVADTDVDQIITRYRHPHPA